MNGALLMMPTATPFEFGSALGLTVECQASYWGCFRVELDGTEIFNRWKTRGWLGRLGFGREPSAEEIISQIRHRYNLVSDGTVGFPWPGEAATKTFDGDDQLDKGADLFEPQTMRRS